MVGEGEKDATLPISPDPPRGYFPGIIMEKCSHKELQHESLLIHLQYPESGVPGFGELMYAVFTPPHDIDPQSWYATCQDFLFVPLYVYPIFLGG